MDKKITIMEAYMKFVLCEIYVCSNLIVRKLTSYSMRKSSDIRRYARTDRQRHTKIDTDRGNIWTGR